MQGVQFQQTQPTTESPAYPAIHYMALEASDTGFKNSHKEKTDIKRQR